jgi:hypothetical protein
MPITFTTSRDVPADANVLAVPVYAGRVVAGGGPLAQHRGVHQSRE